VDPSGRDRGVSVFVVEDTTGVGTEQPGSATRTRMRTKTW
jgi:hypothetical protein